MFAWLAFLDAHEAHGLSGLEGQLKDLTTPEPRNDAERNVARRARVTALREHIAGVRAAIYPPDEPGELTDG